jgi:hypothetical protein
MLQVFLDVAIGILQVVGQHVCMQVRFLVKALVAALEATEEGLFTSVDPQMSLQIEV